MLSCQCWLAWAEPGPGGGCNWHSAVSSPVQVCPGSSHRWMFHCEEPAPTGVILLQQPEAGGQEQRRGNALLSHSPAGCSPRGRQSWGLLGFSQPQRGNVGTSSCLFALPSAADAPLGSVLATMLSPPSNRGSSKPSAATWGEKQKPQV